MPIDFRSDTFTKPSPAMLDAMLTAEVGDDVFGEDPSVNRLEAMTAEMFGMEAAIFCPSGTMTNQIAIKCHTQPGDEVICEKMSHVYVYEGGGIAFNSGCQVKTIDGNRGRITTDQVEVCINPDDLHRPVSRLVSLENTTNRGGGCCYEFAEIRKIRELCLARNIRLHLDGARLRNSMVAKSETPRQYGEVFDSISVCLSKGLGAPVGSVLLGNAGFIGKARRIRKVLGGAMRQSGFLAAACIFALEHNIQRLADDHHHAHMIATALQKKEFVCDFMPVETNILIFGVQDKYSPKSFAALLKEHEIFTMPISKTQVRMVVHLDITPSMVERTIEVINNI
jgi:threonine aldolase